MQEVCQKEYDIPNVIHDDSYIEGVLLVTFERSCGEFRARQTIAESGEQWVSSDFKYYRSGSDKFTDNIFCIA